MTIGAALVSPTAVTNSSSIPGVTKKTGRYNLAGDLISSSQLQLQLKQAEQLTKTTVGPVANPSAAGGEQQQQQQQQGATSGTGKKKNRWSLWGIHHHNHDSQHRRAPSSG